MMKLGVILLCALLLMSCATRFERAEADIMEMYRDCLKRKQIDAKVDCSEFRTAIEIRRER